MVYWESNITEKALHVLKLVEYPGTPETGKKRSFFSRLFNAMYRIMKEEIFLIEEKLNQRVYR